MKYNRKKAYEILREFTIFCKNNDIWYSAADRTLLGIERHGGFIPWYEKLQVMMSPESYRKLLRLKPNKIIDSSIIDNYKKLTAAYVENSEMWDVNVPFIEIIIVVPTTIKKVKKFKSIFRTLLNMIVFKRNNLRNAIDDLYDTSNEGFFLINSKKTSTLKNWIPNISFKTETRKFEAVNIEVLKESKKIMENNFGTNYMEAIIPNVEIIFPAPGVEIKEKI